MPEQFAFQKRFGKRGAVDGHKGSGRKGALLVNGARHKLLARAGFSPKEHRGHRRSDLRDLAVHFAHGAAVSNHLVGLALFLEGLAEFEVFAFQGRNQFLLPPPGHHHLRNKGRDGLEKLQLAFKRHRAFHAHFVNRKRAHHVVRSLDGHAEEGKVGVLKVFACSCFVKERRLVPQLGNRDGPPRGHHPPRNAFAEPVASALLAAFGDTAAHVDGKLGILGVEDGDHAALHARMRFQYVKHALHDLLDAAAGAQELGDAVQRGEAVETEVGAYFVRVAHNVFPLQRGRIARPGEHTK